MKTKKQSDWRNASWEGCRIAQLKRSLKLSPKQRFEALQSIAETSEWLANASKISNKK